MVRTQHREGSIDMSNVFGVYLKPQTYLNTLYLLFSFPLGIGYFVFLVTGFSVGFGTIIIWVGLLILLFVLEVSILLTKFERTLTSELLDIEIPVAPRNKDNGAESNLNNLGAGERIFVSAWRRLKVQLGDMTTWTGIVYLFAKFPLGIAAFVSVVVTLSVSWSLTTLFIWYRWTDNSIGSWDIDTFGEAVIFLPIGLLAVFVTPHLLNLEATLMAQFARFMLGSHVKRVAAVA